VRFPQPQRLRTGLEKAPASREHDPHVRFFESRNPGHAKGDELVCLTELLPGQSDRRWPPHDDSTTLCNSLDYRYTLWSASNLPASLRFRHALRNPEAAQQGRLRAYLERNASTAFRQDLWF